MSRGSRSSAPAAPSRPAIVRDLAESEEVDELLLLDLDAERAEAVADAHGERQGGALETVDARDGLAAAIDGLDVLVNSASYRREPRRDAAPASRPAATTSTSAGSTT